MIYYIVFLSPFLIGAITIFILVRRHRNSTKFERSFATGQFNATSKEDPERRRHGREQLSTIIQRQVEGIRRTPKTKQQEDVRKTARALIRSLNSPTEFALLVTDDSETEIKTWYFEIRSSVESLLPPGSPRKVCKRCGEQFFTDLGNPDSKEQLCTWCEVKPPSADEIEFRPDTPERIREIFIYAHTHAPVNEYGDLQTVITENELCEDDNARTNPGVFLDPDGGLKVAAATRLKYSVERAYQFSTQPRLVNNISVIESCPLWLINSWKRQRNVHAR